MRADRRGRGTRQASAESPWRWWWLGLGAAMKVQRTRWIPSVVKVEPLGLGVGLCVGGTERNRELGNWKEVGLPRDRKEREADSRGTFRNSA